MLPFTGYNMADYWGHWLEMADATTPDALPKIFSVNWFRRGADGSFLWPGFGENSRVLEWVSRRVAGEVDAVDTPLGRIPVAGDLQLDGVDLADGAIEGLFEIDRDSWGYEADLIAEYFEQFGDRLPAAMADQLATLRSRLAQ
jgi:phosphoenolpyruvate carboxykinase (GTP)